MTGQSSIWAMCGWPICWTLILLRKWKTTAAKSRGGWLASQDGPMSYDAASARPRQPLERGANNMHPTQHSVHGTRRVALPVPEAAQPAKKPHTKVRGSQHTND